MKRAYLMAVVGVAGVAGVAAVAVAVQWQEQEQGVDVASSHMVWYLPQVEASSGLGYAVFE